MLKDDARRGLCYTAHEPSRPDADIRSIVLAHVVHAAVASIQRPSTNGAEDAAMCEASSQAGQAAASASPEPGSSSTAASPNAADGDHKRTPRTKRARVEEHPPLTAESPSEPIELNAKLLASRQHIEERREATVREFKSARVDWKLPIVRSHLVSNVLDHLGKLTHPAQLWRNTVVTFVGEDGIDEGGLTADLHSSFWREVLKPEHGLFEQLSEGGAYLPAPKMQEASAEARAI